MFKLRSVDKSKLDGFHSDIATIKQYLCEVGNTYLLIAYRIYEMYKNESYKKYYKTITEACSAELGFKKSTTYNMINIVKRFGVSDDYGFIAYNTFVNLDYSYSQLCEMLSLSDKQLQHVTPQMTVKEIREIKKVQTSGKIVADVIDVSVDKVEPIVSDLKCTCTCSECCFAFITFKKNGKIESIMCSKFNYHYVKSDFYCAFADFKPFLDIDGTIQGGDLSELVQTVEEPND